MTLHSDSDAYWMGLAAEIALRGLGRVEPNPLVGCVIVRQGQMIAAGYHEQFGGPHAEIAALAQVDSDLSTATMYVTLEPCSHFGKTPPCADEVIRRGVRRVVVAVPDPNPIVNGQGIERLRGAGIDVTVGVGYDMAIVSLRPYLKRVTHGYPWVIAKWAMSLDGKIATRSGQSRWLTSPESRQAVHQLRGRVDAIVVGIGTVLADDPMLTARPAGPRIATRVVLDSMARTPLESQLAQSAHQVPTLIATATAAPAERIAALRRAGCEVWVGSATDPDARLDALLRELSQRGMTNILVEAGGRVMSAFQRIGQIDEVRAFIAPCLIGGQDAPTPLAGDGVAELADLPKCRVESVRQIGEDIELIAIPLARTIASPDQKSPSAAQD